MENSLERASSEDQRTLHHLCLTKAPHVAEQFITASSLKLGSPFLNSDWYLDMLCLELRNEFSPLPHRSFEQMLLQSALS